jgi:tetratricopeptide (TPR) repeat protein
MRKAVVFGALVLLALLVSACAPTKFITVRALVPPEIDVPQHIKTVAVLEFGGHQMGKDVVSTKLEQEILNNGFYKVAERSAIAAIINEKNFQQTDLTENDQFLNEMKILNVHALINGSVATFDAKTPTGVDISQQRYLISAAVFNKDGRIVRPARYGWREIREPWIMKQASVNATFKMVDVGTGQILASVSKGGSFSTPKIKGNAAVPTDAEALERAALDAVVSFIKKISVWTEVKRLPLKKAKGCANGSNFAANGLYDKAEAEFRVAAGIPGNFGAVYNLGLALEAQGRFEEAEQAFDQALSMMPTDQAIMNSLQRIRMKIQNADFIRALMEREQQEQGQ